MHHSTMACSNLLMAKPADAGVGRHASERETPLENPFVTGILEAYWDAYENVGLNVFTGGYEYLQEVWQYHKSMADAICNGNFEDGYKALVAHTDLLYHRP